MIQPAKQRDSAAGWMSGWAIALAILVLVVAVFLSLPFEAMRAAAWVPSLQATVRDVLRQTGPFLLVALLAAVIGLSEVTSTFSNYPREALRTNWAKVLVLTNASAATLAYVITQAYAPATANPLLLAVGTGVGFQALIRTRFVLAREFGSNGNNEEVSVNLGWLYDKFQALCKTQIDLELMNNRRSAVTRLVRRYPTVQELHGIAAYTIEARATLTAEEEAERQATLETLSGGQAPADIARAKIALFILETGGQAFVDFLLQQLDEAPARPDTPQTVAPVKASATDGVVRQLAGAYSLADLVKLADQLTTDPALREWIKKAATPAPGVSETQQKATIGYRLVKEAGLEAVQRVADVPASNAGGGAG